MNSTASPPEPPPLPAEAKKKWQFSLRTMMIGMTGFAVLLGLISALPYEINQIVVGFLWLAATGWILTGLIFAKGDQRAFCVGAAVVLSSMWTRIGGQFMQGMNDVARFFFFDVELSRAFGAWLNLTLLAGVAILNGRLCIYARRYFERETNS